MGDVLAVAEQRGGKIRPVANEVVTVAATVAEGLGGMAHALLLGGAGIGEHAGDLGHFGAEVVRVVEDPALEGCSPETHADVIAEVVSSHRYAAVLFAATALGKDLAPRVAALVDAPLASDVTHLETDGGRLIGIRPIYGGKAITRVGFEASPAVLSLRPNAFNTNGSQAAGRTELFTAAIPGSMRTRIVDLQAAQSGPLDVSEASVIVSGGRGMKGAALESPRGSERRTRPRSRVGRLQGRRRRGMAASRRTGGSDGQDRRSETLLRGWHFGGHPAPRRNENFSNYRRHKQGSRRTHLCDGRLRYRG